MNTVFQEICKYEKIMENELTEYHRKKAEDAIEKPIKGVIYGNKETTSMEVIFIFQKL